MADDTKPHELPKSLTADEVRAIVAGLLPKAGNDPAKLNEALVRQNRKLRDDLAATQAAVIPKDHVAVPKADAILLAEYQALGPPKALKADETSLAEYKALGEPAALKAAVEELPTVKAMLATREHEAGLAMVASKAGYQPDVLKRLAPVGTVFVPAKAKVKNKAGKEEDIDTFQVKDTGPDGKERVRSLPDWEASDEVKPLLPALKPMGKVTAGADGLPVSASSGLPDRARERPARDASDRPQKPAGRPAMAAAGSI